ncbi:cysteine hydrolase family protein [Vibrio zhugei]|uniref:Cysteine hydrolase family protein n=1 Tax=Vibrio zhugei TaxID=2479546 RepID=A0ABV7CB39_9VIBR|nr:cysteine hydrolase family protein [Vibrio zhugei]
MIGLKPAILVIDVQRALFDPHPQPFEAQPVIERINTVTQWARAQGYPVIFIQHDEPNTVIARHSEGWQLPTELTVTDNDHRIYKQTPDSFLRTDLHPLLEQLGITELIVCGYATEFCVDTTTRRAAGLGYPVTIVADAHTTHDKAHASADMIRQHHNASLPSIGSFGVTIKAVSTEQLVRHTAKAL